MARASREKADRGSAPGPGGRALRAGAVALALGAAAAGICIGLDRLRQEARATPPYVLSAGSLRLLEGGPAWLTPEIRAELDVARLDPEFPRTFSLLDAGLCERIARAYEKCPWVERVDRVVKHDPRASPLAIEVKLRFRRPIAFVPWQGDLYLVDEQGVRLPGVYAEPRLGTLELILVTGAASAPPPAGRPWPDEGLLAGVRVARAVEAKRQTFDLAAINVDNYGGRRNPADAEVVLHTRSDTRIKWGRAPASDAAGLLEKTAREKVAYLEYVYQVLGGRVDGVISYIDIPNEVYFRRPPATDAPTRLRS